MSETKIVRVSELSVRALSWVAGKAMGMVTREAVTATDADVEKMGVPFTLYDIEVARNESDDEISAVDVVEVTVVRYGINHEVGATGPSITAHRADRRRFLSSVDGYFLTKEEAEHDAKSIILGRAEDFFPDAEMKDWKRLVAIKNITPIHHPKLRSWGASWLDDPDSSGCARCSVVESTLPIAYMRCLALAKFGETVEVPVELV